MYSALFQVPVILQGAKHTRSPAHGAYLLVRGVKKKKKESNREGTAISRMVTSDISIIITMIYIILHNMHRAVSSQSTFQL